jgi:hypothetical protein
LNSFKSSAPSSLRPVSSCQFSSWSTGFSGSLRSVIEPSEP